MNWMQKVILNHMMNQLDMVVQVIKSIIIYVQDPGSIKDDENMDGKGRSLSLKQINLINKIGWDALIKNDNAKKIPKGKKASYYRIY